MRLVLICDGGLSGPSQGSPGYGSVLIDGWCLVRLQFPPRHNKQPLSSIMAEALTVLEGLRFLAGHLARPGNAHVVVNTDCKAVVKLFKHGTYRNKLAWARQEWDGLVGLFGEVEIGWVGRDRVEAELGH